MISSALRSSHLLFPRSTPADTGIFSSSFLLRLWNFSTSFSFTLLSAQLALLPPAVDKGGVVIGSQQNGNPRSVIITDMSFILDVPPNRSIREKLEWELRDLRNFMLYLEYGIPFPQSSEPSREPSNRSNNDNFNEDNPYQIPSYERIASMGVFELAMYAARYFLPKGRPILPTHKVFAF